MQGTRYDVMIIGKSISFMKKFQIKAQSNSRARQLYIYIYMHDDQPVQADDESPVPG